MAIRLIVTVAAKPGKGPELAKAYPARSAEIRMEPGCEQFEVFQSVENPDKLLLFERWKDQKALDVHAALKRPPLLPEFRSGSGEREDYEYNRTR